MGVKDYAGHTVMNASHTGTVERTANILDALGNLIEADHLYTGDLGSVSAYLQGTGWENNFNASAMLDSGVAASTNPGFQTKDFFLPNGDRWKTMDLHDPNSPSTTYLVYVHDPDTHVLSRLTSISQADIDDLVAQGVNPEGNVLDPSYGYIPWVVATGYNNPAEFVARHVGTTQIYYDPHAPALDPNDVKLTIDRFGNETKYAYVKDGFDRNIQVTITDWKARELPGYSPVVQNLNPLNGRVVSQKDTFGYKNFYNYLYDPLGLLQRLSIVDREDGTADIFYEVMDFKGQLQERDKMFAKDWNPLTYNFTLSPDAQLTASKL